MGLHDAGGRNSAKITQTLESACFFEAPTDFSCSRARRNILRAELRIGREKSDLNTKVAGNPNAGAGSRFIEYSADLMLDLDAKKSADGGGEREVVLTLSKNRNGAAYETVKLEFNGALQRFREAG